ncbi:MAG: hypothetical protein LBP53_04945, partial [Candidatus Peribacteria bacterium]|nr:hypothetical protein [Candidatus Peribacteria bacterium]
MQGKNDDDPIMNDATDDEISNSIGDEQENPPFGSGDTVSPVEGSGELETPDEDIFLIEEPNDFQTFATATDIELAVSITGANQTV